MKHESCTWIRKKCSPPNFCKKKTVEFWVTFCKNHEDSWPNSFLIIKVVLLAFYNNFICPKPSLYEFVLSNQSWDVKFGKLGKELLPSTLILIFEHFPLLILTHNLKKNCSTCSQLFVYSLYISNRARIWSRWRFEVEVPFLGLWNRAVALPLLPPLFWALQHVQLNQCILERHSILF